MNILVTGGAGFIGSHVADGYVQKGHRVVVVDNLSTGSRKNINPKTIFYRADIRSQKQMRNIVRRERPRVINHHAAFISVVQSVKNPVVVFRVNVEGTLNLLIAFSEEGKAKHKKFIYASTGGALYGEPGKIPADEATPVNPLSPYGLSKSLAEKTVEYFAREFQHEYLVLRYSNVYGPRQNPYGEAGVVAIFEHLMRQGKRPTIFGNGMKTRDYVYVKDVVRANLLALTRGKNTAMNIGCGKETKDQEVFDAIARCLNVKKPPRYALVRPGEVARISLDAGKAKKVLGWKPETNFKEGIRKTLLSF